MTSKSTDGRDSSGDPVDLAEWGLHCYCPTARRTPHGIVAEKSNGRVLYEARGGVSLSELRARGVSIDDEQLAQLIEFRLLDVEGDVLRTAFPTLNGVETTTLRRHLRPLGELLAERLAPLVANLRQVLDQQGLGASTYAIVFGYALDGLLWDRLAERDAVPDTALSVDRPWWNGAFWAVQPAREGAAGTNFVDCGPATLVQVWTDKTVARLNALAAAPQLPNVVRGIIASGESPTPGEVIDDTGVTWRLRRPDGAPAIPVVGTNGPLDRWASQLADAVVDTLIGAEAATARAMVSADDPTVATVVIAHELIWHITEALVASAAVPPAHLIINPTAPAPPLDQLFIHHPLRPT